jgi:hypothetical protein
MSVLIFDIPREDNTLEKKINRELHSLEAEMLQHSVWKTDRNEELIKVAMEIKNSGGKAVILEERMIFE